MYVLIQILLQTGYSLVLISECISNVGKSYHCECTLQPYVSCFDTDHKLCK